MALRHWDGQSEIVLASIVVVDVEKNNNFRIANEGG